jgi:hypothetical protein
VFAGSDELALEETTYFESRQPDIIFIEVERNAVFINGIRI